jgi:hypothetical protein
MSRIARINLAWLIALPAAVLSAPPTVVDLGENMLPQSVSDSGAVVVGLSFAEDNPGVFRWTPRGGTQLIGGLVAGRPDVSADGTTIAATVVAEGIEAAFWTERSGWVPLSATDLVPALPGWASVPHVISANGKRLAGGTIPPPVDYGWERAFSFNPDTWDDRWADYGWQELPKAGKGRVASTSSRPRPRSTDASPWAMADRCWVRTKTRSTRLMTVTTTVNRGMLVMTSPFDLAVLIASTTVSTTHAS